MPIVVLITIACQIFCGVHAVRTGRAMPWLFVIILFGPIGCAIYAITQILPDLSHSRAGRQIAGDLSRTVNPDKELRRKVRELDMADTAENKRRLAEECISREMYDEAADLYERALEPPFDNDATLMMGLARARFGQNRPEETITLLDDLREEHPDYESSDGHLLYARALTDAGRLADADHEYSYLVDYYPGEEPRYRYGELLLSMGDVGKARGQFQSVVDNVDRGAKHYHRVQREWYEGAKRHLRTL